MDRVMEVMLSSSARSSPNRSLNFSTSWAMVGASKKSRRGMLKTPHTARRHTPTHISHGVTVVTALCLSLSLCACVWWWWGGGCAHRKPNFFSILEMTCRASSEWPPIWKKLHVMPQLTTQHTHTRREGRERDEEMQQQSCLCVCVWGACVCWDAHSPLEPHDGGEYVAKSRLARIAGRHDLLLLDLNLCARPQTHTHIHPSIQHHTDVVVLCWWSDLRCGQFLAVDLAVGQQGQLLQLHEHWRHLRDGRGGRGGSHTKDSRHEERERVRPFLGDSFRPQELRDVTVVNGAVKSSLSLSLSLCVCVCVCVSRWLRVCV